MALPDLERIARDYLSSVDGCRKGMMADCELPADRFMRSTILGLEEKANWGSPRQIYRWLFTRDRHCWMWDAPSLMALLKTIGFAEVRETGFRESLLEDVGTLDLESRKHESFYVEAVK